MGNTVVQSMKFELSKDVAYCYLAGVAIFYPESSKIDREEKTIWAK